MTYFKVPLAHSLIEGVDISVAHVLDVIAEHPDIQFLPEHLYVRVNHDGTNHRLGDSACYWEVYITASASDQAYLLNPTTNPLSIGVCLKYGEVLKGLIFHKKRHKGDIGYFLDVITFDAGKEMRRNLLLKQVASLTLH
jgi:hypothetical protein